MTFVVSVVCMAVEWILLVGGLRQNELIVGALSILAADWFLFVTFRAESQSLSFTLGDLAFSSKQRRCHFTCGCRMLTLSHRPLCVLFSALMVELRFYAVARIHYAVFDAAFSPHGTGFRTILFPLGAATVVLGGVNVL